MKNDLTAEEWLALAEILEAATIYCLTTPEKALVYRTAKDKFNDTAKEIEKR